MHAQCMLSEERGGFCFLRAFSKNAPKRQIIIFHLASYGKMSQKVLSFYWEGKMVVIQLKCSVPQLQNVTTYISDGLKPIRVYLATRGPMNWLSLLQRVMDP